MKNKWKGLRRVVAFLFTVFLIMNSADLSVFTAYAAKSEYALGVSEQVENVNETNAEVIITDLEESITNQQPAIEPDEEENFFQDALDETVFVSGSDMENNSENVEEDIKEDESEMLGADTVEFETEDEFEGVEGSDARQENSEDVIGDNQESDNVTEDTEKGAEEQNEEVENLEIKDLSLEGAWDGVSFKEPQKYGYEYQIRTATELAWFANEVNQGNTFEGKSVYITGTIVSAQQVSALYPFKLHEIMKSEQLYSFASYSCV